MHLNDSHDLCNLSAAPDWLRFAPQGRWLQIDSQQQHLYVFEQAVPVRCFSISTALNGLGEQSGSGCTPRGWHVIRAKIGAQLPDNAVLVGRRWTQECYSETLATQHPERDWILGRILWLSGLERGKNRLGHVDTMQRYIYLHGTPDSEPMGIARSHGCIRMRTKDITLLFEEIAVQTPVYIA
ncbi:L,D-transpeptidase catalytic domain [Oceanospirillum multiglobuliferum]|uniref:L,D-transpeptidase n=1 Tax=Oceanospirillum multiglobuliferum TaxID=64969 RepID=UPI0009998089|nr:L,D-transpeptidase [Oceanospirillum multiglobuliferum]SJZ67594.1 L,D-transpeptidase catalytic domain [Oceanospirillum multiglobuliferum]